MTTLTFASWNVNSLKVRLAHVVDWLERSGADALALQETKLVDSAFPRDAFAEAGFDAFVFGQKTYNGVALLVRRETLAASDPVYGIPGYPDPQRRLVGATLTPKAGGEPIRFLGGYFPNGAEPGAARYLYKLDWIAALVRALPEMLRATPRLILGGDFNIAPTDADLYDPEGWAGGILCSAPERRALEALLSLGLVDSYRLFAQPERTYSWWDYRRKAFEENKGVRIDLLLVSEALRAAVRAAGIDAAPRALAQPSDHAPVWVKVLA